MSNLTFFFFFIRLFFIYKSLSQSYAIHIEICRNLVIFFVPSGVGNANPSGPLIGWDPDIVEALDEDFDLDDPDNILDDDFVLKANQVLKSSCGNSDVAQFCFPEVDVFRYDVLGYWVLDWILAWI